MNAGQYLALLVAHERHMFKHIFTWTICFMIVLFVNFYITAFINISFVSVIIDILSILFVVFMFRRLLKRNRLDALEKGLVCKSCKKVFGSEEAKHADRSGKCLACDEDVPRHPLGEGNPPCELSQFQCILLALLLIGLFVAGVVLLEKTSVLSRLFEPATAEDMHMPTNRKTQL